MIILVHGQKRSGKNYLGSLFEKYGNFKQRAFADAMKDIISITFNINREFLEKLKNEEKEIYIKEENKYVSLTNFRRILQYFGTEAMKKYFGRNVWAELCFKEYKEDDKWVITDLRFLEDELLYVKNKFKDVITIKIIDNSIKRNDIHISEKEIDDKYFDYIFDNSKKDPEEAKKFVIDVLKKMKNKG